MEVKSERSVDSGNSKCLEGSAADRKGNGADDSNAAYQMERIGVRGKDCFKFVLENGRKKENGEIASNEIP